MATTVTPDCMDAVTRISSGAAAGGAHSQSQGGAVTENAEGASKRGAVAENADGASQGGAVTENAEGASKRGAVTENADGASQGGAFTENADGASQGGEVTENVGGASHAGCAMHADVGAADLGGATLKGYRTAMCAYGAACKRSTCTFAHSESELLKRACSYRERCFLVTFHDGEWVNKLQNKQQQAAGGLAGKPVFTRTCGYYHPGETYANFRRRTLRGVKQPPPPRDGRRDNSSTRVPEERPSPPWAAAERLAEGIHSRILSNEDLHAQVLELTKEVRHLKRCVRHYRIMMEEVVRVTYESLAVRKRIMEESSAEESVDFSEECDE
jgi:hypothetical protein